MEPAFSGSTFARGKEVIWSQQNSPCVPATKKAFKESTVAQAVASMIAFPHNKVLCQKA